MRRIFPFVAAAGLVALMTPPAMAGWREFWHRVHVDWHRNNAWPEPFSVDDRQASVAPFAQMIENGWRLQNTLSNELFDVETQQLTRAGQHSVHMIVTQAPPQRRSLFVLRGPTPEATEARLDSVQRAIAAILPAGELPQVHLTDTIPAAGNGEYFNRIHTEWQKAIPAPVLPPMETQGGG